MGRGLVFNGVKITYKEYLKSEQWAQKRREAIERAGFRCQLCGWRPEYRGFRGFHVHHNNYLNVGAEQPFDLVTLCETCHNNFHRKPEKRVARPLQSAKGWGRKLPRAISREQRRQDAAQWRVKRNHLVCRLLDAYKDMRGWEAKQLADKIMRGEEQNPFRLKA